MATIVTRAGKGSPLTNTEVDANFSNLNNDKIETNAEVRAAVEAASDSNVFTDADHTKLNAIEASADVTDTANVVAALTAGSNITIASDGTIAGSAAFSLPTASASALGGVKVGANLAISGAGVLSSTDTNTTYSVQDGQLSQNNFTNADHTKLNAIEASADVTDATNVVAALTAGANIAIASDGTISSTDTDTNTTYSVQDGELSQNNFTNADHSKLNAIEASATADQTAAQIMVKVLTVDGAGTNLDADKLDGQEGSYYTGYVDTAISNLIDGAPAALNTLDELAAALGDSASFASSVTNSIAAKLPLSGGAMTGAITTNSTFAGRNVASDGSKLDAIEAAADVTDTANVVAALTAGSNVAIASNGTISATDTNTTYSVQDGGLSQNNFTNADHTKLNAIEASADVTDTANVVAALTAGSNITIASDGTIAGSAAFSLATASASTLGGVKVGANLAINGSGVLSATDTNTTYSVQDGGLSQNNFTNSDHTKLNGIATGATAYTSNQATNNNSNVQFNSILVAGAFTSSSNLALYTQAGDIDLKAIGGQVNILGTGGEQRILFDNAAVPTAQWFQNGNQTKLGVVNPTATRNINLPNASGTISLTDTTYSVGDGGLSEINFTSADHTKLNGITAGANFINNTNQLTNGAGFITSAVDSTKLPLAGGSITGNVNFTAGDELLVGGTFANNAYNSNASSTIYLGGGNDRANYSIGTLLNNYGGNYTKLDIRWHTGIRMFAVPQYGGMRYYTDNSMSTKIFSIGENDSHVRVSNNLIVGGTVDGRDVASDGSKLDGIAASANNYSLPADITQTSVKFTTGPTLSEERDQNLKLRAHGSGVDVGITGYDGQNNWRFQLYGGSNGDYGFLNANWSSWDIKKTINGNLYLNNNTTYFLNPAGTNKLNVLDVVGAVTAASVTAATFSATSDRKLKTNIAQIETPLAKLQAINGVTYAWKEDGRSDVGVIAQDVEKVLPAAVHEDEKGTKSVNYNALVGLLIETVKEQQKQIDALKTTVGKIK